MDIISMLNGVKCECGKTHSCDIGHVYVESGAIDRLKELCKSSGKILIVADENTYSAAGARVEKALHGKDIEKIIFGGDKLLIPNEEAIMKVREKLECIDLILGVGSGVIQDLCKYVSFFEKIPYMVVATAPSMDGYASNGAAMILNGMKETVPAGLPKAIIADIEVLKNAPLGMIKAGYGDIIGKYSALNDWVLSHIVTGEYFCKYIYDTTYDMIEKTQRSAAGLLKRDGESIKILMQALIVVGIMMSFAGTSRPASGSEHHLSHFFEIVGIINSEPYFVHGIDVAYSTVITAQIREKILENEFPDEQYVKSRGDYVEKMSEIYKSVAESCVELQDKAGSYTVNRMNIYKQNEKRIREVLAEMPGAEEIKNMLSLVELDMNEFYNMYDSEKIANAIMYAKDLKDRYTVLWMNYELFGGAKND